ncbi:hypothetical protein FPZ12_014060 [Amycolatopsis acidicola]|uniref:Uncharacterized protein n=1 Tax=Amycolatopsis acidicola TaxID=2596893 RepID=A0A5N0V821_9PSEU|nr:hypothetical protein [Amycolatopsis acidicola]KAA9161628.1 hypothetical protein FPZ12_014060 [Amycolatopsis acidicola]
MTALIIALVLGACLYVWAALSTYSLPLLPVSSSMERGLSLVAVARRDEEGRNLSLGRGRLPVTLGLDRAPCQQVREMRMRMRIAAGVGR